MEPVALETRCFASYFRRFNANDRCEKQHIIANIESAYCLNCDFFDFYDYYDGTLDGTRREKTMRPSIGEKKDKK
jgi:hypothetical protein